MEEYVRAYKPNKGDILELPFAAFVGKGSVGNIIYTKQNEGKLYFVGDDKFAVVNEIPKFLKRLRNAWVRRKWILYLCAAERLDKLGIEYKKKSDIQYSFIDYVKTVIDTVRSVFRRIYMIEVISD